MVKKHKGGRRQILQLEDKKPAHGEWEPTSTATMSKESSPLDSQVADFFKEIDALTVNEQQDDGSDEPNLPADEGVTGKENSLDGFNPRSHDNGSVTEKTDTNLDEGNSTGLECPWQEICDESSGYNYYWNVQTNEVTWDCPIEYAARLKYENCGGGERATQSCQSPSNETEYKSRKRKENLHIPEGAIIPISYFGGSSSSDESCSGENENKLISSGKKMPKIDLKPSTNLKSKISKKEEVKNCDPKNDSSVDLIGPQLPPDFQFPKNVPLAPGASVSRKESYMSAKNEVEEEYLEVGPQLPSSTPEDCSRSYNSNTVLRSDSSTFEFANPSQSNINAHFIASSSTQQDSWETSLVNIERKFKELDKETGEESPDSTVKKGDASLEHSAIETNNEMLGFRPVVEYDSFTDEEDDLCSDISSSKEISFRNAKFSAYHNCREDEYECGYENKSEPCVLDTDPQESIPSLSVKKSSMRIMNNSHKDENMKKRKKNDIVDIDSLFAAHAGHGKRGFGFNRQNQSNLESGEYYSTIKQDYDSSKTHTEYKTISFVKSDHVFDLGTLNNNFSSNTFDHSEPCEKEVTVRLCKESANVIAAAEANVDSNSLGMCMEAVPKQDMTRKDFKHPISQQKGKGILSALKGLQSISDKFGPNWKKKKNAAIEKRISCKVEADLDEIDKALCEALEAKKTSENFEVKAASSTSPIRLEQRDCIESSSSVSPLMKTESDRTDNTDDSEIMADIVNLYTVLVDKLSFLLSNHSTLASLSALLVQLQTRIVDWQAGALESKYFMSRLQEVHQYLHHYEMGAGSGEWTCQWDRENKRYFYVNNRTHHSRWMYPEEICSQEKMWICSSEAATSSVSNFSVERDEPQTVSSSVPEGRMLKSSVPFALEPEKGIGEPYTGSSSINWMLLSSPPPPPPGVDSPPPPPPDSPPPESPPPPPPDSTEVEGELPEDMDLENSNDSASLTFISKAETSVHEAAHVQLLAFAVHSPMRSPETLPSTSVTNAVSSTSVSGSEDMNFISKTSKPVSNSLDSFDSGYNQWNLTQPSCSSESAVNSECGNEAVMLVDPSMHSTEIKESDVNATSSSGSFSCSTEMSVYRKSLNPYSAILKKEKKKSKLLPGLALKKKNIPSLVQKWQKIKAEQEKEDKNSDDSKNANAL